MAWHRARVKEKETWSHGHGPVQGPKAIRSPPTTKHVFMIFLCSKQRFGRTMSNRSSTFTLMVLPNCGQQTMIKFWNYTKNKHVCKNIVLKQNICSKLVWWMMDAWWLSLLSHRCLSTWRPHTQRRDRLSHGWTLWLDSSKSSNAAVTYPYSTWSVKQDK